MDSNIEWVQPNSFHANGLLLKGSASVSRPLDSRRWALAEARTAELISRIQPSWESEKHRNAVASYVQHLISNCVPCQVFTFGSVPLKTYLPDGDIDLSAFSDEHSKKDDWANSVLDMLRREEKNEHAEFEVKEVQYIQAEVKIIKCLVDNIVVDISFNQLGGLCTLCFLEEIDYLIRKNHLFKRSVILIKAWCYYESRILGAHHGLISTYALETLVLYIFHVFNNSFAGPLEVLYRFVEFFSKFDWDNFCVSLWGPVPICSLPSMAADPPRKDGAELLLNKIFLHACSTAYSVYPGGQENQEQPFISKYFNVVDPLRINNNLGRSVSKGNFYRIRSAFSFGAQKLARILECQEEAIVAEVNQFFVNTWNRHEKGFSPDAPDAFHFRIDSKEDRNRRKYKVNENPTENSVSQYPQIDDSRSSIDFSMQPVISPVIQIAGAIDVQSTRQRDYEEESRTQVSSGRDQYYTQRKNPIKKQQNERERNNRANILLNRRHTCPQFARTSSSPELTSISSEAAYLPTHNAATEREKEFARSSSECNRRMRGFGMENCVVNCFTDEPHTRESSSCFSHCTFDSNQSFVSNPVCSSKPVLSSCDETNQRHEDEQEFVNLMSSSGVQKYGGHFQVPVNLISHPLVSLPPSIPGFKPQLYDGAVPLNLPARADWGDGMQYSGPSAAFTCQQFDPVGVTPEEETTGGLNGEGSVEVDHCNEDHAFWTDNYADSVREIDDESEKFSSASSRLSPASPANSFRTKASSESSWDGQPSKIKNMVRCPEKKNSSSSKNPTVVVKSPWLNDGRSADQTYVDESAASSKTSSHVEVHQLPRFGQAHTSYPNSMFPLTPLLVHSDSPQGVNQNHAVPVAFYPAGLTMPFVTMVYNGSAVTGISGAPASHDDLEREKPNFHLSRSNHNSDSAKGLEQLRDGTRNCSTKKSTSGEHSDESGLDIFNSDFASHWKNLQYGRLCQNSLLQHPFMYSPSVVPPLHLQGNFSSDTPQSPYLGNPNIVAHLVPVSAQQPGSHKRAVVSRQYDGEATKNRNGTGTYFPNPKVLKDHQSSTYRQYQGDFKHERNEPHWEREANWNFNSKPRFSGRGQPRYRYDKSSSKVDRSVANGSQTDRHHDSFCRRSYHLNRFPKDTYIPKPRWNVLYDADYSVYQTHSKYHDEVSHSETAIPPLVMLYPYHPSIGYGPQIEPLQFGSVGPHHFVGADEVRELSGYPKHRDVKLQNYQGDTKGFSSKIPT